MNTLELTTMLISGLKTSWAFLKDNDLDQTAIRAAGSFVEWVKDKFKGSPKAVAEIERAQNKPGDVNAQVLTEALERALVENTELKNELITRVQEINNINTNIVNTIKTVNQTGQKNLNIETNSGTINM